MSDSGRPRVIFGILCAATAALCATALSAENKPIDPPTYSVPVRPLMFQFKGDLPSVELVGVDLAQDGVTIQSTPPSIESGTPLDITLHLRPISDRVSSRRLRINIRPPGVGPAPGYLDTFEFGLGDWQFRHIYPTTYQVELPKRQFVGRGTLSFWDIDPSRSDWLQAARLYAMEIHMPATVWKSGLDDTRVHDIFGPDAVRLRQAFTIGPETRVRIPIELNEASITAIGIISNATWTDSIGTGTELGQITLGDPPSNRRGTHPIRFGEHTNRAVLPQSELADDPSGAAIAWTDRLPGDEERYRCFYKSIIEFDASEQPAELVFDYTADEGLFHVYELIVLVDR